MSNQIEIVSVPQLWRQPSSEAYEQAKASFLSHERDDDCEMKIEKDDSDESPF